MATKEQVKNFIEKIAPIVVNEATTRKNLSRKWVLPSVAIAQAACESAWGQSTKMVAANALFGIKVGKSKAHFGNAWKDKAYSTKTKECYDGKTYTTITDMFRAYDSIEDSVEDYFDMLSKCTRYRLCLNNPSPFDTISAIKNGGYATSPTYINTIMSIINTHNLDKYDYCVTNTTSRKTLRIWSMGEDVLYSQEILSRLGYYTGKLDGIFGPKTQVATEKFQSDYGLKVDGIIGPKTWAKLQTL